MLLLLLIVFESRWKASCAMWVGGLAWHWSRTATRWDPPSPQRGAFGHRGIAPLGHRPVIVLGAGGSTSSPPVATGSSSHCSHIVGSKSWSWAETPECSTPSSRSNSNFGSPLLAISHKPPSKAIITNWAVSVCPAWSSAKTEWIDKTWSRRRKWFCRFTKRNGRASKRGKPTSREAWEEKTERLEVDWSFSWWDPYKSHHISIGSWPWLCTSRPLAATRTSSFSLQTSSRPDICLCPFSPQSSHKSSTWASASPGCRRTPGSTS